MITRLKKPLRRVVEIKGEKILLTLGPGGVAAKRLGRRCASAQQRLQGGRLRTWEEVVGELLAMDFGGQTCMAFDAESIHHGETEAIR